MIAGSALLAATAPRPAMLWNATDSEPRGIYVRWPDRPALGRLVAFRAPQAAFPYADARMDYLHRVPILKAVAAAGGDEVCTLRGELRINGRWRAPVLGRDPRGRPLPQWDGCRRLSAGEFFVFSDRIPNSFDSRYYGPIRAGDIVGVFRPLMTISAIRRES